MRRYALQYAAVIVAVAAYYTFFAEGVLALLSLTVPVDGSNGAPLAAWLVLAEAMAVAIPFAVLALIVWLAPALMPRGIWIAPLLLVGVPVLFSAVSHLLARGVLQNDFAFSAELAGYLSIAVDLVAALLGSALVIVACRRSREGGRVRPARARSAQLQATRR